MADWRERRKKRKAAIEERRRESYMAKKRQALLSRSCLANLHGTCRDLDCQCGCHDEM